MTPPVSLALFVSLSLCFSLALYVSVYPSRTAKSQRHREQLEETEARTAFSSLSSCSCRSASTARVCGKHSAHAVRAERRAGREREKQRQRETERERDGRTDRQTGKQTGRQRRECMLERVVRHSNVRSPRLCDRAAPALEGDADRDRQTDRESEKVRESQRGSVRVREYLTGRKVGWRRAAPRSARQRATEIDTQRANPARTAVFVPYPRARGLSPRASMNVSQRHSTRLPAACTLQQVPYPAVRKSENGIIDE